MANLTAVFELIDRMSDKLDAIADRGENAIGSWEQAEAAADGAYSTATRAADGVASAAGSFDEASDAIGNFTAAQENATDALDDQADVFAASGQASEEYGAAIDELAGAAEGFGKAAEGAGEAADYWTEKVGSYDKSLLEAVYSTEELVEMGYKSADALQAQEDMLDLCEQSATSLSRAMDATTSVQEELTAAIDKSSEALEELADNENVSVDTKTELTRAAERAQEAMDELTAAQENAAAAMEEYDAILASGTTDLDELERAAERAGLAAERLAEANGKATEATEELGAAADKAGEEAEQGGKSGVEALGQIAGALAAAKIAEKVMEIAEAAYDLAAAFDEGQSIIVKATGASGDALDSLSASMLNVYAQVDDADLNNTAAAIGEINTRLGLTGDALDRETKLFMDFADITGSNVVTSVQNVTQMMKRWGVEVEDTENLLDKLAYAAQASGIGVDELSGMVTSNKAVLDQLGFSLDEAIAMFSQFELEGINTTSVMAGLRTALTSGTISSLEDLYDIFDQIAAGEISASDAADIFGTKAGAEIVAAVGQGALSLDAFVTQLDNCEGTLEATADTADTAGEKWTQAGNTFRAAMDTAIAPTVAKVSGAFAELAQGAANFLNEHPVVTKALTAVAVGLGVVTVGVAAAAAIALKSIPAIAAFGTAFTSALGPVGWIALGITAVVAAGTALVALLADSEDEYNTWTRTTQQQYDALQDLNSEYERACETYGETSEEALRLQYQMEDLQAEFDANKQSVEQFVASCDELVDKHNELISSYMEGNASIHEEEVGTLALIQKLEDLATSTDQGVVHQQKMQAIIDTLNEKYPDLGLSIDSVTESTDQMVEALKRAAQEQAKQQEYELAYQTYVDLLQEQAVLEEQLAVAEANLNAEREAHGMYWNEQMQQWENGWYTEDSPWAAWTTDLDDYGGAVDELSAALAENQAAQAKCEATMTEYAESITETEEATISYEQAAAIAFQSVQEEIEELCKAYDDAYQAALTSFEGQFSLFDTATTESETYMNSTVENAQAALESQLAYWESYSANIDALRSKSADDLGITQENYDLLMSFVQDGSEEAAGLAASMVEAIESGNSEAVAALAETAGNVQSTREEVAANIADWQTNFNTTMDELEQRMDEAVDNLNLDAEASAAAKATIDSYAQSIRNGTGEAVAAAKAVADSVAATLAANPVTVRVNVQQTGTTVSGHASGTTDAEDVFVAGENGPELIVGAGGSTVFPADETRKIINAVSEDHGDESIVPQGVYGNGGNTGRSDESGSVKKVLLEIAGRGNIELTGAKADKESMLAFLYEYLKPVLSEILTQEMFEEGDYSYEY